MANGTWTRAKLTGTEIIQLFVSKSFFHSHYKKHLSKVSDYPLMVEWLKNTGEDRPADKDVWGMEKSFYNFTNLEEFLVKNNKLKAKGKKKESGSGSGSKKTGKKL